MNNYTQDQIRKNFIVWFSAFIIIEIIGVLKFLELTGKTQKLSPIFWTILIIFDLLLFVIAKKRIRSSDNFYQGDEGESIIYNTLKKLQPHYTVLENIVLPNKRGNIDFIVIGPRGISIVEAKSHRGYFTFHDREIYRHGKPMGFIPQIESQVMELGKLLHEKLGYRSGISAFLVFSSKSARIELGTKPLPGTGIVAVKKEWINNCILDPKGTDLNNAQIKQITELLSTYQKD